MSQTLTQNLRLANPVKGTQPTLWWNTENVDRSLVDQAACGFSTWTVTTTTLALTIGDGSLPSASSRVWTFQGNPPGPVAVTFGPNTSQNWALAINNTSQPLIFTQGAGGSFTLFAGSSAILRFNGQGSGASVTSIQFSDAVGRGTVAAPVWTYAAYQDVGLYVPVDHAMAIAANGIPMAAFFQSGSLLGQLTGLNVWGIYG